MRAIKRFMGAASIELERHLQQGDFLIVIDNFSNRQRDARTFKRKTDMITKFISTYSANHFILFSDESEPVSAKVEKVAKFEFTHKSLYVQPLQRRSIRELTKRWLGPTGLDTPTNVKAVLDKLVAFNLPRTAHVVSMVLWTLEKEKGTGQSKVKRLYAGGFVEANLNRQR